MKFFLEEAGYTVTFFDDGYSALDRIRVDPPELLITEMILPHLDGLPSVGCSGQTQLQAT